MASAVDRMKAGIRRTWLLIQWLLAAVLAAVGYALASTYGEAWLATAQVLGYRVQSPEYAWLLVAIPVLVAIRAHTRSDFPWYQQALSLLLKSLAVALVTLSAMDVREVESESEGAAIVFVVDVSESVPDAMLTEAGQFISTTIEAADRMSEVERPEIRLVTFSDRARENPIAAVGTTPRFELTRLPPESGTPGTDLGAGLRLGLTVVPEGRKARIVLVTDGHRTRGSLSSEIEVARRFGTPIDHLSFKDFPIRRELVVMGVEVPKDPIEPRIPFQVKVTVTSSVSASAKCTLTSDKDELAVLTPDLVAGPNELVFEARLEGEGTKPLLVRCEPTNASDDTFASNNAHDARVTMAVKPKILYVEGEQRLRANFMRALEGEFDVTVRGPRGTPSNAADANQFDLIAISDVPRLGDHGLENMSTNQMRTLERYARDGGGLLFLGGENAFGPGGYGQTALERDVLPVRLEVQRKQDTPSLALVLAMDRSGSMSGPKIELAKQAAIETLNVLQSSDLLGVFPFDTRATELVPLQRAGNRFRITEAIAKLTPGGGTNIFVGLDAAYNALLKVDAKVKHIILMTDGQSNRAGVVELATQANLDRITVSTVAVGVGSDTDLLRRVAEAAGGRYYFTNSPNQLPQLFLKETSEVTRKALVEDRFKPRLDARFRTLQMFGGIDINRMPALLGYVSTKAKPQAEVLMTTHLGEPLFARWRLGLGYVVVWTSDVKNKWAHAWLTWPGYAKFWRQVVRDHLRVVKPEPEMPLELTLDGEDLVVTLDAIDEEDRFIDDMANEVVVRTPDGADVPISMTQIAAGRYEGRYRMKTFGAHSVVGKHAGAARVGVDATELKSEANITWPFPDEHGSTGVNLTDVKRLSEASGGLENPPIETLLEPREGAVIRERPRWPDPLRWVLALLVLDVMLRRVRFQGRLR